MTTKRATPARELVNDFLEDCYTSKVGNRTLIYQIGQCYKWAKGQYIPISDEEIKMQFTAWVNKREISNYDNTRRNAEEALHHIKTKMVVSADRKMNTFLHEENIPKYIAFKNCIVDMQTAIDPSQKLVKKSLSAKFFNTVKIPYEFDTNSDCPTWFEILNTVLPDKEDQYLLQEWFGYHFIPSLSISKMMFLKGKGANGKSVILLVLRILLGDENVSSIPLSAFDPDKTFKLAATENKLANICEEGGQVSVRTEEALKQYVNGGAFTVERKFKDPHQMYPTAKLTVSTNDFPQFKDKSDGIWRRILPIDFKVQIPTSKQNHQYIEKDYWLNSGELPGILNWALQGAKRLAVKNKFSYEKRREEILTELKINSDPIRQWVADNFVAKKDFLQQTAPILERFNNDAKNGLIPRVSLKELFKEIESQFTDYKRPAHPVLIKGGRKCRVVIGVRFVGTTEQADSTNDQSDEEVKSIKSNSAVPPFSTK